MVNPARTGESVNKPVDRDLSVRCMIGSDTESRISRGGKINVKKPGVDLGQSHAAVSRAVDRQHHLIPPAGGGSPVRKFAGTKL